MEGLLRACQPAEALARDILQYLVLNLDLWSPAPPDTQRQLLKLLHKLGQVTLLPPSIASHWLLESVLSNLCLRLSRPFAPWKVGSSPCAGRPISRLIQETDSGYQKGTLPLQLHAWVAFCFGWPLQLHAAMNTDATACPDAGMLSGWLGVLESGPRPCALFLETDQNRL